MRGKVDNVGPTLRPGRISLGLFVPTFVSLIPTVGPATPSPISASPSSVAAEADTTRRFQPADLFRLHRVGAVRFSPDGRRFAYARVRAGSEGEVEAVPSYRTRLRSDIWVVPVGSGEARPLTDGGSDGTGWFYPRWSPDGERLALLSVRGNRVRAWIWDTSSDTLRKVSNRGVHIESTGPLLVEWLSPEKLALAVQEEDAPERGRLLADFSRPGFFAVRYRQRARSGEKKTVHVLESGLDSTDGPYHEPAEILVVDVADETATVVARGRWGYVRLSPSGRSLATFSVDSVPRDRPLLQGSITNGTKPGVARLREHDGSSGPGNAGPAGTIETASEVPQLYRPRHRSLQWAPDGSAYALLTRTAPDDGEEGARGSRAVAIISDLSDGDLRRITRPGQRITEFAWTGASSLLVRTRRREDAGNGTRADWWRVSRQGDWLNLTSEMTDVPDRLVPAAGGSALGVADGELWRLAPDGGRQTLSETFRPQIHRIVWPEPEGALLFKPEGRRRPLAGPLVVMASERGSRGLWVVRPSDAPASRFARIPANVRATFPSSVSPDARAAAFSATDSTGTWLWMTRPGADSSRRNQRGEGQSARQSVAGTVDTLMAADRWLSTIDAGETRKLTFRHRSGRELIAWMILPPGHEEGERHPTVVDIYPGSIKDDDPPRRAGLNLTSPIAAMQLLASEGYAVLFPSIPLRSDGPGPRASVPDALVPAVRKAVEVGLTDSARVGLIGHSYGGYGVYNLVSQTDRFRAAVASAGKTDLRASYGIFDARARYGHMMLPQTLQMGRMAYMETGQGRMGGPPWKAPERYRKNSPLTYVDQVETPLMMIHGDQDFVPIQQAEMFFSSLLRQGKPARFVRYSGEGHILRGRANVLDMWERIVSWFDRFLKGDSG